MKLGIVGCVMVADGKTFGRFLMIFCVLGGKIGKVVLTLIFDYFLKFGGCGVEGLAGLSEEDKLDVCLSAYGFQLNNEIRGERDDVFLAFFCGYGCGRCVDVCCEVCWCDVGCEHRVGYFATQVVHVEDVSECFVEFAKGYFGWVILACHNA